MQSPVQTEVLPQCQYPRHLMVRALVKVKDASQLLSQLYLHTEACSYDVVHHREGSIVFIFKELSLSFTYEFSRVAEIMEGICVTKQGIAEYRNIDQNDMTVWKAGDCNVVPTPFYLLLVHSLFVPSHSSPPLLLPLTALIPTPFVTL